jgi:hypothetical protein
MKKILISIFVIVLLIGAVIPASSDISLEKNSFQIEVNHDDNFDLIIITESFLTSELESLVQHKNKYGVNTMIMTTEEIYSEYQGRDNAEKIKYFIKDAKEKWNISYVMLLGDQKYIPFRKSNIIPFDDIPYNYISDLYYADVYYENGNFSSWDNDNDGIYCEWYNGSKAEDNQQDLIPDVAIGRLVCSTPNEVHLIVNKIINYEKQVADPSWFNNLVVAGGETFVEYEGFEGEIMTQNAIDVMDDFNAIKLWISNGKLDRFSINIVRSINRGCGFLYLAGHGNTHSWATLSPEGKTASRFTIFHLPFLINKGKYPVCILSGCHVCKFSKYTCIGWQLTKKQYGGSIATIGPTAIGYLGFEWGGGGLDWLELQFFKEYANETYILGDIWREAITKYLASYPIDWDLPAGLNCAIDAMMVQEWVLIGDPSLKIGGYS